MSVRCPFRIMALGKKLVTENTAGKKYPTKGTLKGNREHIKVESKIPFSCAKIQ